MSIQVWHQPESGRIALKLQVARGSDSTFPALPACRKGHNESSPVRSAGAGLPLAAPSHSDSDPGAIGAVGVPAFPNAPGIKVQTSALY